MFKYIKNFFLCLKYPFLKCGSYKYTWYDDIPTGWQKAFGQKLCDELKRVLKEERLLRKFRFVDVKEKYGALRISSNFTTDKIDKMLTKYEIKSMKYCINCGKPAKYETPGWITYYCKDCMKEWAKQHSVNDIEEFRIVEYKGE